MEFNYILLIALSVLFFILCHKLLTVFYGLSSTTGRSSVILGFHVQVNCESVGDSAGEAVEDSGPFEESAGDTIKNHVKPKIKVK